MTIERTLSFALWAHENQPYTRNIHIPRCVEIFDSIPENEFSITSNPRNIIKSAVILHDTREDTELTYSQIKLLFNERIANLVEAVTDSARTSRYERHYGTQNDPGPYIKIPQVQDALWVKYCDRYANWENALLNNNKNKIVLYMSEYPDFKTMLDRGPFSCHYIWNKLDELMVLSLEYFDMCHYQDFFQVECIHKPKP